MMCMWDIRILQFQHSILTSWSHIKYLASSRAEPVDVPIDTVMATSQPHLQKRFRGVLRQGKS
eukprot:10630331-Prorocentrum_lima.AAC.1